MVPIVCTEAERERNGIWERNHMYGEGTTSDKVRGKGVLLVFVIHDHLALYPFIKPITSLTMPFASGSGDNT